MALSFYQQALEEHEPDKQTKFGMETVFYFSEHDHYFDAQGRIMGQVGNDGFNRILPFYSSEVLWLILFGINKFVFVFLAVVIMNVK